MQNTADTVKTVELTETPAGVIPVYGGSGRISCEGDMLTVQPGKTVAVLLSDRKPLGLYKDKVMLTAIEDGVVSVEGKRENTDVFFAVYSERKNGIWELLCMMKNPVSADLSKWQGTEVEIRLLQWDGIAPAGEIYALQNTGKMKNTE